MEEKVESALRDLVGPLLEADGGGIELVAIEGDTVVVRLLDACGGCPGAPHTKTGIIEPALQKVLGRAVRVKLERRPSRTSVA